MQQYILKRVNARYSQWDVSKKEYERMKEELPTEEFARRYEALGNGDNAVYREKSITHTSDELHLLMAYDRLLAQEKSEHHLRVIKGCVIFFTLTAIIGIIYGIAFGSRIINLLRLFD